MKSAKAIPVLMYHHVSPHPGLVTVSPETFQAQMQSLHDQGWHTISTQAFSDFLNGQPLPKKSVLVTFDDGYLDNWVYAYPVLKRLKQQATIFLITGAIGEGEIRPYWGQTDCLPETPNHKACKAAMANGAADQVMMNWSEVLEAKREGVLEFHSHTHSHQRFDKLFSDPTEKKQALLADLQASIETIQSRLQQPAKHLCWPQGYYDDDYLDAAKSLGFEYLYTTEKHINTAKIEPYRIGRVVTKDKPHGWLGARLCLYQSPFLGGIYLSFRGKE